MTTGRGDGGGDGASRRAVMRACAYATEQELEAAIAELGDLPSAEELRPPQTGLVMLRGRIGGSGPPFNLGEATVTRAALRLPTGAVGHAYLLGRSHKRARLAALIDALAQQEGWRAKLEASLVAPVTARCAAADARRQAETASTKVEFFTLQRGEA
jgi:alpha-D-ribose 1-methylphosphonate 5-triphosphate synthase subunit PhnG